eukprot:3161502-Rhodomonas_salina.2
MGFRALIEMKSGCEVGSRARRASIDLVRQGQRARWRKHGNAGSSLRGEERQRAMETEATREQGHKGRGRDGGREGRREGEKARGRAQTNLIAVSGTPAGHSLRGEAVGRKLWAAGLYACSERDGE